MMIGRHFQIGMPALGSLVINALMLMALINLGVGNGQRNTENATLKVLSLEPVMGVEEGEKSPEPATPAQQVPPPLPQPPAMAAEIPKPVVPMPMAPIQVAVAAAPAEPATPAKVNAPHTTSSAPAITLAKGVKDGAVSTSHSGGNSRSYAAKVRSWLLSHKTYPKYAKMRKIEGVVWVFFSINRHGALLDGRIITSSGHQILDDESAAMLRRAAPYPTAPRDVAGDRFEIKAPIVFTMPV